MFDRVDAFVQDLTHARSRADLGMLLEAISSELGFRFFAMTHHVDIGSTPRPSIRIDNYPAEWVAYFDSQRLGVSDPVHRASHRTSVGFAWSKLSTLIPLTSRDHEVLALAGEHGIGNGFTVPANVPGESFGSCSFATQRGIPLQAEHLPLAQLVGAFGFEAARRLFGMPGGPGARPVQLTDRQRECLVWAARGKSDWEISRILGISQETVVRHLKMARERYGVTKRTELAVRALFDGVISFEDVFWR